MRQLRRTGRFADNNDEFVPAAEALSVVQERATVLRRLLDAVSSTETADDSSGCTRTALTDAELKLFSNIAFKSVTAPTVTSAAVDAATPTNTCKSTASHAATPVKTAHAMTESATAAAGAATGTGTGTLTEDTPLPTAAVNLPNMYCESWNANFFDFRGNALPKGATLVGTAEFERQPDHSTALSLEPGAYVHLDLSIGSMLPAKASRTTVIVLEILCPVLPRDAASLVVYNPGFHTAAGRAPDGDALLSSDGGVGALGRFGLGALMLMTLPGGVGGGGGGAGGNNAPPVVVPGEWTRVVIVRCKDLMGEQTLSTYINGALAAQIVDPLLESDRFAIARNEIDIFRSARTGLQLPFKVRVAAVFASPTDRAPRDLLKVLNKTNFMFSSHRLKREAVEAKLFASLTLAPLYKRPPPLWMHSAFLYTLSAPLLAFTSEVGAATLPDFLPVFSLVLRGMLASSLTTPVLDALTVDHRERVAAVAHSFARALPLAKRFPVGQNAGPAGLLNYLKLVVEAVGATRVGETTVVPLALTQNRDMHTAAQLAYIVLVERTTETACTVVIVNTSLDSGLRFHPTSAAVPGALQYHLSLPIEDVPLDRVTDGALWAPLISMIDPVGGCPLTPDSDLYARVLMLLTQQPIATTVARAAATAVENPDGTAQEFAPLPLLAGSPAALCREAMRFMLRRRGLSRAHAQLVDFGFQARLLELAHSDVVCFPRLSDVDARALLAAVATVAGEAARCSAETGLLGTATLASVCASLKDLSAGIDELRTSYDDDAPPMLHLDDGGVSHDATQHSLFPFMERFVRYESVDGLAGTTSRSEDTVPYDVMRLPTRARTFDEISSAILYTHDQAFHVYDPDTVRNRHAVFVTLIEHLVTRILPIPVAAHASEEARTRCPWQTPITHSLQARLVYVLGDLTLWFTACASFSKNSRALDYTRLVVVAALTTMVDSLMRRRTTDFQSPFSLALFEGRFGPGPGAFAEQTATAIGAYPELQVVRSQVMAYFTEISVMRQVFLFNEVFFSSADMEFMKDIHLRSSLPTQRENLSQGLMHSDRDCSSHVMDAYPELRHYRDVCFYLRFLQANVTVLTEDNDYAHEAMTKEMPKPVKMYSHGDGMLRADFLRHHMKFQEAPMLRFPPGASVPLLTDTPSINTEDDVLHVPSLPDFDGALGQADSELLLSYLTVPYLRIPLVLGFFASEERINALKSSKLCGVLEAVLFEPGRFLPIPAVKSVTVQRTLPNGSLSRYHDSATDDTKVGDALAATATAAQQEAAALAGETLVPVADPATLATRYGLLLNELIHAPGNVLSSAVTMVELALALDIGTVQSSSVSILLFVFRMAARVENYAAFALRQAEASSARSNGTADSVNSESAHSECDDAAPMSPAHVLALADGLKKLRRLLWGRVASALAKWGAELWQIIRSVKDNDSGDGDDNMDEGNDSDEDDPSKPISLYRSSSSYSYELEYFEFRSSLSRDRLTYDLASKASVQMTGSDKRARELAEDQKALKKLSSDAATRLLCDLHAHTIVLFRNVDTNVLLYNPAYGASLVTGMLFLTTRHSFGKDTLQITEHLVFEAMHTVRRSLVTWLRKLTATALSLVMEATIRVVTCEGVLDMRLVAPADSAEDVVSPVAPRASAAPAPAVLTSGTLLTAPSFLRRTSSLKHSGAEVDPSQVAFEVLTRMLGPAPGETPRRVWRYIPGPACTGLFVSVDLAPGMTAEEPVDGVGAGNALWAAAKQGMKIDTQSWQLTLKGSQLQVLPQSVMNRTDVAITCGTRAMQAALVDSAKNRKVFLLVGRSYELSHWSPPNVGEFFEAERLYDANDLHPHERWVAELLEPVRLAFFEMPPPPLMIFMPTEALAKNASVAYLVGMHPERHGAWKEFVVYKHRRMVEIYTVISHGRRFYRTLSYTTHTQFSLRALTSDSSDRNLPWADWERYAAGSPDAEMRSDSVIIARRPENVENLSRTQEMFLPARFLEGMLPEGLVRQYLFWQDDNDNIRGYPVEVSNHTVLFIEMLRVSRCDAFEEAGVSVRVTRMPRTLMAQRAGFAAGAGVAQTTAYSASISSIALEDEELELVNLLHAPKYSQLFQIASVLSRIEGLSNVLAWKRVSAAPSLAGARHLPLHTVASDDTAASKPVSQLKLAKTAEQLAVQASKEVVAQQLLDLPLIELPNLKMSFHTRVVDGECRLYSLDHSDLYVSNARSEDLARISAGIPHSLIMSNDNGELSMLVPCVNVARPTIASAPLSTELVLERNNLYWLEMMETRYFLYPIHVSLSFVFTPTLASALYLMLLRLLHRDYAEVFRLADTIGSDTELSGEERQIFEALSEANTDVHADACACRLKIALALMDSTDVQLPWLHTLTYCLYAQRIAALSASCRLSFHDEIAVARLALPQALCGKIRRFSRPSRAYRLPTWAPMLVMAYNRLQYLEAMVYGRSAFRTLTVPPPDSASFYTADIGTLEEMLVGMGHKELLSAEALALVRPRQVRVFSRPVKQVYASPRNTMGVDVLAIASRYLAHSEKPHNLGPGALGFMYIYQLLQSDIRVKIAGQDCASTFGLFALSMMPLRKMSKLLVILRLMAQRPDIAAVLPRWSVFKKSLHSSDTGDAIHDRNSKAVPLEGFNAFVTDIITAIAQLYKINPILTAAPYGTSPATIHRELALAVVPRPAQTGLCAAVPMRAWIIPQLSDYDCDVRYLFAAPSGLSHADAANSSDAALERRVKLQMAATGAGAGTASSALRRALRLWEAAKKKGQRHLADESWTSLASEAARGLSSLVSTILGDLSVSDEVALRAPTETSGPVGGELPINVRAHPGVQSGVALAMQTRMEKDTVLFSTSYNSSKDTFIKGLTDADVRAMIGSGSSTESTATKCTLDGLKANLTSLIRRLTSAKADDERVVKFAFYVIKHLSRQQVSLEKSGDVFAERLFGRDAGILQAVSSLQSHEALAISRHMSHWLAVISGHEPELKLEYVIGALLSSRAVFDLRKINPFLPDDVINVMMAFTEAALLRANRIGHINRTLGEARDLLKLLDSVSKVAGNTTAPVAPGSSTSHSALIAGVIQKSKALGTQLTAARFYCDTTTAEAVAAVEGADAVAEVCTADKCGSWLFAAQVPEEHLKYTESVNVAAAEDAALAREAAVAKWEADPANAGKDNLTKARCCVLEARVLRRLFKHGMRGDSIPVHRGPLEKLADEGMYGVSRPAKAGVMLPVSGSTAPAGTALVRYDPRFLVF